MALLAGCGFNTTAAMPPPDVDAMAALDAARPIDDATLAGPACATVVYGRLTISACPDAAAPSITVTADTTLDTDTGSSTPPGLTCIALASGASTMCALAAGSIKIAANAKLSARGARALLLIGHAIDIQGTLDVASHAEVMTSPATPAFQGAAADLTGCNGTTRATGDGGGQGGTFNSVAGGIGGDGNSSGDKGGLVMGSINIDQLRGGCAGGAPSGAGTQALGGHGGGAVWIATDPGGTISLGDAAVINASGAGGLGGTGSNHGGLGGGSGGMILLNAGTLTIAATAKVFADGGGGGGGAAGALAGGSGGDPAMPGVGGSGGVSTVAVGGIGYPAIARAGATTGIVGGGGGGGGGGAGTIWLAVQTLDGAGNISPPATRVN
jgi:hypothetical protein